MLNIMLIEVTSNWIKLIIISVVSIVFIIVFRLRDGSTCCAGLVVALSSAALVSSASFIHLRWSSDERDMTVFDAMI